MSGNYFSLHPTSKEEQVEELVEYLLDSMDMEELEYFVRYTLTHYYLSDVGTEHLNSSYAEMKELMGDE